MLKNRLSVRIVVIEVREQQVELLFAYRLQRLLAG